MKKYLWLALVLAAGVLVLYVVSSPGTADEKTEGKVVTTDSGLKYQDLKEGTGDAAKAGDVVQVHYTGWLTTDGPTKGTKFDSSVDRGKPFPFKLGNGDVIKGWDEGVAGMKVGGKRGWSSRRRSATATRGRRRHSTQRHPALRGRVAQD